MAAVQARILGSRDAQRLLALFQFERFYGHGLRHPAAVVVVPVLAGD